MNNQPNRMQVGRLTGQVNADAGIMRYRGLVAHATNPSMRGRTSRSRFAGAIIALVVLMLALSVGTAAQVVEIGSQCLTPGHSGCGATVASTDQVPPIATLELAGGGGSLQFACNDGNYQSVELYCGELCCGAYTFAP